MELFTATHFRVSFAVRLLITNEQGNEVQGARLGDTLRLLVDIVDEQSVFGTFASDLIAQSEKGNEALLLIDDLG